MVACLVVIAWSLGAIGSLAFPLQEAAVTLLFYVGSNPKSLRRYYRSQQREASD